MATLRVTPVIDGSRAFVEWSATFDCPADEHDRWTTYFRDAFAGWLGSLREHVEDERMSAAPPRNRGSAQ